MGSNPVHLTLKRKAVQNHPKKWTPLTNPVVFFIDVMLLDTKKLLLIDQCQILPLGVITSRDSYPWNYRELATLLTLSESLAEDEFETLTIGSIRNNLFTQPSRLLNLIPGFCQAKKRFCCEAIFQLLINDCNLEYRKEPL